MIMCFISEIFLFISSLLCFSISIVATSFNREALLRMELREIGVDVAPVSYEIININHNIAILFTVLGFITLAYVIFEIIRKVRKKNDC